MRTTICAVGRLKRGPELDLVSDYLERFDRTGRALGLGPAQVIEVEDRTSGGADSEAVLLRRAIPKTALIWCLDERGSTETSPEFANRIARCRDDGQRNLALVVGGADGIAPDLRSEASHLISFGKMVWPHMLARVMLAEQLYRAASILAGNPYHRA